MMSKYSKEEGVCAGMHRKHKPKRQVVFSALSLKEKKSSGALLPWIEVNSTKQWDD